MAVIVNVFRGPTVSSEARAADVRRPSVMTLARCGSCRSGPSLSAPVYLTVTVAPAPSRAARALSAASLLTRSSSGLGAPSTRSLASLSPRLVRVRTSLMTWIFLSPAASRMTSNSSFSSGSSAAAPPRARSGSGDGHRRGRLDVEGLLELLHELRELDQRHLLERIEQVVCAELCHGGASSSVHSVCRRWLSATCGIWSDLSW